MPAPPPRPPSVASSSRSSRPSSGSKRSSVASSYFRQSRHLDGSAIGSSPTDAEELPPTPSLATFYATSPPGRNGSQRHRESDNGPVTTLAAELSAASNTAVSSPTLQNASAGPSRAPTTRLGKSLEDTQLGDGPTPARTCNSLRATASSDHMARPPAARALRPTASSDQLDRPLASLPSESALKYELNDRPTSSTTVEQQPVHLRAPASSSSLSRAVSLTSSGPAEKGGLSPSVSRPQGDNRDGVSIVIAAQSASLRNSKPKHSRSDEAERSGKSDAVSPHAAVHHRQRQQWLRDQSGEFTTWLCLCWTFCKDIARTCLMLWVKVLYPLLTAMLVSVAVQILTDSDVCSQKQFSP